MTPRELAGLIRKGAAIRPQSFGGWCLSPDGESCALGAAVEGLGIKLTNLSYLEAADLLKISHSLANTIMHKNDAYHISREDIATWLESLDTTKPSDREQFDKFMQSTLEPVEVIA